MTLSAYKRLAPADQVKARDAVPGWADWARSLADHDFSLGFLRLEMTHP